MKRPIASLIGTKLTKHETQHSGHATELMLELDLDAFDAIMCISGDGVINGEVVVNSFFFKREREREEKKRQRG